MQLQARMQALAIVFREDFSHRNLRPALHLLFELQFSDVLLKQARFSIILWSGFPQKHDRSPSAEELHHIAQHRYFLTPCLAKFCHRGIPTMAFPVPDTTVADHI